MPLMFALFGSFSLIGPLGAKSKYSRDGAYGAHGAGRMNFAFIIPQHEGYSHGIGRLPTEDLARLNKRLSPLELLHDDRVARLRQGPFSPISCDGNRVAVDPADGLLSRRKTETGVLRP